MLHISKVFHINDMDGSCNNFGSKKKEKKREFWFLSLMPWTGTQELFEVRTKHI